ncbi:hypothetical protein ACHAQJ_009620 [Trichoderma viride]
MDKLISTSDVPLQFLKSAYLVGKIPRKVLASEPRVSYDLYIPPQHYHTNLPAEVKEASRASRTITQKLPLLVFIHGTLRDDCYVDRGLMPFAESTPCAVMAPLFPAGLDGPTDLDSYKLLRSSTLRSDLALLSMLDEVAYRWPGIGTDKIFLMGYSGGGQFVHRFLYLHPDRLAAVSIGAPGSVTFLDNSAKWPAGVADVEALFGKCINKNLIREVEIHLVVGDADVEVHGGEEFWAWLRKFRGAAQGGSLDITVSNARGNKAQDTQIVRNRLGTLKQLRASWKEDNINAHLDIVEGVKHESIKCQGHSLMFLQTLMKN